MFEMSETGCDHCHILFVAHVNGLLVVDRAARLDNSRDTRIGSQFHAIREWEEGITCHYCSLQVEVEAVCLLDSLFECVNTRSLSHTAGAKLFVLR